MKFVFLAVGALVLLVGAYVLGTALNTSSTVETVRIDSSVPIADDYVAARPHVAALPMQELSSAEVEGLALMREEEKLARDVYTALHAEWGTPIFRNIAQSEQTHTETVRSLLEKYSIPDPVVDDAIGAFSEPVFQQLYTDLVAQGAVSLEEALRVGLYIEEMDIYDLMQHLTATDNDDIIFVYENLQRGSRNHLRSFDRQIKQRGISYVPEYISEEEYLSIVSTVRETGAGGWGRK